MNARGGNRIIENNRIRRVEKSKERRHVEYSIVSYKLLSHSSSSSECVERKTYNEKMQFAQTIIHDIYIYLQFAI
jgi:hypothetical protein